MGGVGDVTRTCGGLRDFVESYTRLDEWLRQYEADLTTLIHDHELLVASPPWRITLAVDFREIFMYAFPLSDVLQDYKRRSSDHAFLRQTVLDHLARECLFRRTWGVGHLSLLQPYQAELNYALLKHLPTAEDAALMDQFASELSMILKGPLLERDADRVTLDEDLTAEAQADQLVEFLGCHYMDLSLLLLTSSSSAVERLETILREKVRPPMPGSILHGAVPAPSAVERWQARLLERRGPARRMQSFRDAQALAAIETANAAAKRQGLDELCMLVTSTNSVLDVVSEAARDASSTAPDAGFELPPVRNLRHFLVYLKNLFGFSMDELGAPHALDEVNPTVLANLKKAQLRASEFLSLSEASANSLGGCPCREAQGAAGIPHDACPLRPLEPKIEETMLELRATRDEIENTQLILKNHPDLRSEYARIQLIDSPTAFDSSLRALLDQVLETEGVAEAVSRRVSGLVDKLVLDLLGINIQVSVYLEEIDEDRMSAMIQFPFYAEVQSEPLQSNLRHATQEIELAARTCDLGQLTSAFKRLVKGMMESPPPAPERLLVQLLILLAMGETETAAPLVHFCRKLQPSESADMLYLAARATIDLSHSDALGFCEQGTREFPDDARFPLVEGWILWRESCERRGGEGVLVRALEATERGVRVESQQGGDSALLLSLLNNKAYFLATMPEPDLDGAAAAVSRMEEIRGTDRWRGSWLDTRGFVYLQRAVAERTDESKREDLLCVAVTSLEKALSRFVSRQTRELAIDHLGVAIRLRGEIA